MTNLNKILIFYFVFLNIFSFFGLILRKKSEKNQAFKQKTIYKICPCRKMAQSGSLSLICMYSAMGGFLYSASSISFIGFADVNFNLILLLTLICAILGWKLKLE